MVMWRVKRVDLALEGTTTLNCFANEEARQVTLEDTDTGEIAVTQICVAKDDVRPCTMLDALGVTYTPNDWSELCGV